MLNAVNLTFVALGGPWPGTADHPFFVMTVAAAEAAVGLALIISLFRHRETLSPDVFTSLKWYGRPLPGGRLRLDGQQPHRRRRGHREGAEHRQAGDQAGHVPSSAAARGWR